MRAIVQNAYGSPAVLELREIDRPLVRDDGVLVRVHAAALHAGDYFVLRGVPYLVRFVAGWPKPRKHVPGFDLAGHVEAVGKKVTLFRPGDEVFAACDRACAEYACGPEGTLALKPTNLTFEQAAAVPTSALAALHGLRDAGKVQPGQRVLVNGASGGVGTFAVQIAKIFRAGGYVGEGHVRGTVVITILKQGPPPEAAAQRADAADEAHGGTRTAS